MTFINEIIDCYDSIYRDEGIRESDSFYDWILQLLDVESGKKVLDISCGEGLLNKSAEKAGLCSHGLDISREAAKIAQRNVGQSSIIVANGDSLPYRDGYFDYVTNLGSLEHYLNPGQGIREIARVLNAGGVACILLPNSYFVLDIIFHILPTGRSPSHDQPLERFATRFEWQELIERNGLTVYKVVKYNAKFPRTISDLKWYLNHRKRMFTLPIAWLIPLNLSYTFVFLCRKRV